MMLRKINAVFSLLVTIMLLDHAMFQGLWMLSNGAIPKHANSMPWILFAFMLVHAIISIVLGILGHKGATKGEYKGYANLNKATYFQRTSGILLIVFTVLHISSAAGGMANPKLVHAIFPPLFFAIALMHTAISGSKAFITLGIGNAKFIDFVDVAIKTICFLTLIIDIAGFYLYLV